MVTLGQTNKFYCRIFILKEVKETILDVSQETVTVL